MIWRRTRSLLARHMTPMSGSLSRTLPRARQRSSPQGPRGPTAKSYVSTAGTSSRPVRKAPADRERPSRSRLRKIVQLAGTDAVDGRIDRFLIPPRKAAQGHCATLDISAPQPLVRKRPLDRGGRAPPLDFVPEERPPRRKIARSRPTAPSDVCALSTNSADRNFRPVTHSARSKSIKTGRQELTLADSSADPHTATHSSSIAHSFPVWRFRPRHGFQIRAVDSLSHCPAFRRRSMITKPERSRLIANTLAARISRPTLSPPASVR